MRVLTSATRLALLGTHVITRRQASGWTTQPHHAVSRTARSTRSALLRPASRLFSSSPGDQKIQLQHINKLAMEEIITDYEDGGREESGYVVIDVREPHEIEFTGKVSPSTITLPLQTLMQYNVFALPEDEFEEICGFEKPTPDETMVFSCAAGVRSVHAANFAAQSGYTKLVNYMGGANEWFM